MVENRDILGVSVHLKAFTMPGCFSDNRIKRTLDSLNEGLPIKWLEKSFKENDIFCMKKIVGSTLK